MTDNPRCWVITLPKSIDWNDYMRREVMAVADGSGMLNYKVAQAPKAMRRGDRCYIVWNGRVRGWMEIVGIVRKHLPWRCEATGATWPPGIYVQRSGPFHAVKGPAMVGFRGVRAFTPDPDHGPQPAGPLFL